MGARATFYTREGFSLDKNTELTADSKDLGVDLSTIKTVRVIVVDAVAVQAAGAGTNATLVLQGTANAPFLTITSADLLNADENGVYIAHIRGALLPAGTRTARVIYTAGVAGGGTAGTITGQTVYLDAVENVA